VPKDAVPLLCCCLASPVAGLEGIINNETLVDGYTILAPTNEAVTAALPLFNLSVSQILSGRDVDRTSAVLATLLDYHILPEGAFTKAQLAGYTSLTPALTLFGGFPTAGNLTIIAPDAAAGNVTFVGADSSSATVVFPDMLPAGQTPRRRGTAPASRKGQGSEAGKPFVLHIVDGVLLPPAGVIANFTTTVAAGVPAGKHTVRNGTGSGPSISVPTGTGPIPGP
jgi:hypothetical protein